LNHAHHLCEALSHDHVEECEKAQDALDAITKSDEYLKACASLPDDITDISKNSENPPKCIGKVAKALDMIAKQPGMSDGTQKSFQDVLNYLALVGKPDDAMKDPQAPTSEAAPSSPQPAATTRVPGTPISHLVHNIPKPVQESGTGGPEAVATHDAYANDALADELEQMAQEIENEKMDDTAVDYSVPATQLPAAMEPTQAKTTSIVKRTKIVGKQPMPQNFAQHPAEIHIESSEAEEIPQFNADVARNLELAAKHTKDASSAILPVVGGNTHLSISDSDSSCTSVESAGEPAQVTGDASVPQAVGPSYIVPAGTPIDNNTHVRVAFPSSAPIAAKKRKRNKNKGANKR